MISVQTKLLLFTTFTLMLGNLNVFSQENCNIKEIKSDERLTYITIPLKDKESEIKKSIFYLLKNDKTLIDINNFYPIYDQSNNTINWYAIRKNNHEFDLIMTLMHGRLGGKDWYKKEAFSVNIQKDNILTYSCKIKF